jgi:hypothetical protein
MSSTLSVEFFFQDSSSSDDSDNDDLLKDNAAEHMILIISVKELRDRANMNNWPGLMVGHIFISLNQVLEAVASEDFRIWHLFEFLKSLNDINVFYRSHLLARLASGDAPVCNYKVDVHEYTMGYYLSVLGNICEDHPNPKTKK